MNTIQTLEGKQQQIDLEKYKYNLGYNEMFKLCLKNVTWRGGKLLMLSKQSTGK